MKRNHIVILIFFVALIEPLKSQDRIHGNAADIYDSKSVFANPAVIPYQGHQFFCGMKVYHLGIMQDNKWGFKNTYLGYSNPHLKGFGFGLGGQFFTSPIYNESIVDMNLSKRILNFFSAGFNLTMLSIGYNRENFRLVDENDPVFLNRTGKTNIALGAGLACIPFHNLVIGIGAHYLNQPNISLIGDNVRKRPEIELGAVYSSGGFRTLLNFGLDDDRQLKADGFIEAFSEELGFLRAGLRGPQLAVEGQLHLWGMASLNYSYDYPVFNALGISQGSHLLGLVFEFGRLPYLPHIKIPPPSVGMPLQHQAAAYSPDPRYEVIGSVQKLEIVEKKLSRSVDSDIPSEALRRLSWFDLVKLDSSLAQEKALPFRKDIVNKTAERIPLSGTFSNEYREGLNMVSNMVKNGPSVKVDIVSPPSKLERAEQLRSKIVFEDNQGKSVAVAIPQFESKEEETYFNKPAGLISIPEKESMLVLSVDSIFFDIVPIFEKTPANLWRLIIQDRNQRKVMVFSGSREVPKRISWDWRGQTGTLIEPGAYSYCFEWMYADRAIHRSRSREFSVKKYLRIIRLRISHEKPEVREKPDEINLIVK